MTDNLIMDENFQLKPETIAEIDAMIGQYPQKRSAVLMILHAIQEEKGFVSKEAMEWTAAKLELQPIDIYELVTFYPMLKETPMGKKQVKVCRTLSCALAGGYTVCERLQKALHCPLNGTSADGEFSIEFVECLASCGTAPVVMVDQKLHENVKPEVVDQWVKEQFPYLDSKD